MGDSHLKYHLALYVTTDKDWRDRLNRKNEPLKPLSNQLNLSLHMLVERTHKNYFGYA